MLTFIFIAGLIVGGILGLLVAGVHMPFLSSLPDTMASDEVKVLKSRNEQLTAEVESLKLKILMYRHERGGR